MGEAVTCPGCAKRILATEGRLPPWCPHCGAGIKAADVPASLPPATAPAPLGRAGFVPSVDVAPTESFFHACAPGFSENYHHLYRIYVTASDLLVFAIGVGPVSMGEVLPRTRSDSTSQAGLAGAMAALAESKQLRLAQRIAELDAADEAWLRQHAGGDNAFRIAPEDVRWMSLGGPSLWYRWICSVEHAAVWKFRHRQEGRWSLALPSLRDARRAAEWLPRIFSGVVEVNLGWGRKSDS